MKPAFTVLIPARLASTRLAHKPLADIAGIPMVVRVAQRIQQGLQSGLPVVVAADDDSIIAACEQHQVTAILTRKDHLSGSDRLAQACEILGLEGSDVVVNVQGDEPLIDVSLVQSVADILLQSKTASMGTAAHPIETLAEFHNPNVVKVVTDASGHALYFSRAPIAWWRDGHAQNPDQLATPKPLRHIGIYAYRAGFLRTFPTLEQAPCERTEALEQLRALWHGYRIAVHITPHGPGPGVDTPEDLERVRHIFSKSG